MKKHFLIIPTLAVVLLLFGCDKDEAVSNYVYATFPIEADAEILSSISVTLPDNMTRETVSNIQHDFIQDGKQIGGIVIVDISSEVLDAPYGNMLHISDLLNQQLMSNENPDKTMFMGAGGNEYAYMEVYTGDDQIRYFHYLFRGEAHNYDVWFACDLIDADTISEIIASISADDITEELNKSIM